MATTFPSIVPSATSHAVQDYRSLGWHVTETSTGIDLTTDNQIAAVELTGAQAASVRRYLRANNLSGPVIELRGPHRREIHLVVGAAKAALAIEALRTAGATVHTDGATIPLPCNNPAITWGVSPTEARWTPPLVALSAAVRATAATTIRPHLRKVAC